jgi:hypothetical protein
MEIYFAEGGLLGENDWLHQALFDESARTYASRRRRAKHNFNQLTTIPRGPEPAMKKSLNKEFRLKQKYRGLLPEMGKRLPSAAAELPRSETLTRKTS